MLRSLLPALLFLTAPAIAQDNNWQTFEIWRDGCPNPNFPKNEEQRHFCNGFNYAMHFMSKPSKPSVVGTITGVDGQLLGKVAPSGIITGLNGQPLGSVATPDGNVLMTSPNADTTLADPTSVLGGFGNGDTSAAFPQE